MWILTGGDDQVHLWRQVFDQKGEGLVDRFGINHVVVVKHEDEALRDGGEFVDQGRQQRFGRRRLRGLERSQHTRANARRNPFDFAQGKRLQSRDEVGQKACEVVIPFVQRQPGHGTFGSPRSQPATHSLTSVVFPNPADAEMSVSLRPEGRPSFIRSISRGRRTTSGRGGGM